MSWGIHVELFINLSQRALCFIWQQHAALEHCLVSLAFLCPVVALFCTLNTER